MKIEDKSTDGGQRSSQVQAQNFLRMQPIDIETIYSQEEKDREGIRLQNLGELARTNRIKFADGVRLID